MAKDRAARQLPEFDETDPWDYKAEEKVPRLIELPARLFAWIGGKGDPNGPEFAGAMGALYGLSYAVRMSYLSPDAPPGAGTYRVGVLQGQWTIAEGKSGYDPAHKEDLVWTVYMRQPAFLDGALFERFRAAAKEKAAKKGEVDPAFFDLLRFGLTDAGTFAQILHRGPYADEDASFERMEAGLADLGVKRASHSHREIYLGDPRKAAPEKLRTILRIAVE